MGASVSTGAGSSVGVGVAVAQAVRTIARMSSKLIEVQIFLDIILSSKY
jgi:F0F1-type ATP synthase membrane subunit c/vacuolar-type H+-ATPase subunit K